MTVEEYFELDEQSDIRYEYYDGEVYAMSGTTFNHNDIVGNVSGAFRTFFRPRGCRVFAETVKLKVSDICYLYPDVVVACAAKDLSGTYIVERPSVVIEVISKSSTKRDRVFKLNQYKTIPSLQYYLIVSQAERKVELYSQVGGSDLWACHSFKSLDDVIQLEAFGFEIPVREVYETIEFAPEE
ncbi:Uma2 family endonuclease [Dyadobacter sp. BHUBP1]|uniref:Uma2 family endonuclease n=1 Tax=Dyadobacter sp. BHUBP1 TaxID=3424178 RepID=UPI003D34184E